MKLMFGSFTHNIDAKNRLFIPASFRDCLGAEFMVVRSTQNPCLLVFSMDEFQNYLKRYDKLDDDTRDDMYRFLYMDALGGEVADAQGRITLSKGMMSYAGLEKGAVINGCGQYAEIWSPEVLRQKMQEFNPKEVNAQARQFNRS